MIRTAYFCIYSDIYEFFNEKEYAITADKYRKVNMVKAQLNEALTYAYMGVNWSLVIPLIFGIGFETPYEWVTNET